MRGSGEGTIYRPTYRDRRGRKAESSVWWIAYTDFQGNRHSESSGSKSKTDALKILRKRLEARDQGKPAIGQIERTTFEDLAAMIETDYRVNGRRSLVRVMGSLRNLGGFFGNYQAVQITSDRIRAYVAFRQESGAANATINRELAALKRALRLGRESGKVGDVPAIHLLHEDNTRKGFFERGEFEVVIENLAAHWQPAFEVGYLTGWRIRSEILTRQWKHVDLKGGWLRLEPGETKNRKGRMFPLIHELRTVIERLWKERTLATPWVFHLNGRKLKDYRRAWARATRKAGLPGKLPHDFRRTAVRNLERAGVPRSAAMALVGHETEAIYRRYAITDETMLREGAEKLSAFHQGDSKERKVVSISGGIAKDALKTAPKKGR